MAFRFRFSGRTVALGLPNTEHRMTEHRTDRYPGNQVKMGHSRPRPTTTLPRRAGWAGLILLAAGCTTDGGRDGKRNDPLLGLGGGTSPPSTAVASATPAGGIQ